MGTLRLAATLKKAADRAASGNTLLKAIYTLSAMLLVFAPPTAQPGGAAEVYDFQICNGYFALCAASTCTPTGKQITVKVASGGTAVFPEADCTCPVLFGRSLANLAGGNMQGSCKPPGPGQIWSTYSPRRDIPQAITNWVPTEPEAAAPPQVCPASLNQGNKLANCFSFVCDSETYISNVPVVTCHCPIGESFAGTPVVPQTAFATQAGQGDQRFCFKHPVSVPISLH
jgi:hypothetical protein